jgi:outer membrane protein assembly factor BamB
MESEGDDASCTHDANWRLEMPRRPFIRTTLLAAIAACCQLSPAMADDWPQWQGPDRNSMSKETGLLQTWPTEGPPLARRMNGLGGGDGAPAISKGRIYVMGTRGEEEVVRALSEKDGQELWVTPLGTKLEQRMPQSQEGPGCTPTVDGDRLYVVGMGGDVACLGTDKGEILWRRSFTKDFGGQVPMWSYRESPLVDGDKVICTPGGPEAVLVALDKATGETIWKTKSPETGSEASRPEAARPEARPEAPPGRERGGFRGGFGGFGRGAGSGAAYSSPIAIDVDGQRQYVQLTAKTVGGISATDGKFLWQYDAPANGMGINCSTPLFHDGLLFAATAYGAGGGAVKVNKEADGKFVAEEVYFSKRIQNHHGGMVVVDGALYGDNGGNGGGNLLCLDFATGEVLWDERSKGRASKGSIAYADGCIYYRGEDGTLLLIEPNKKEYVERGRFKQADRTRSPAWAHPVIANGKLYVRDQDSLYCYDIAAK